MTTRAPMQCLVCEHYRSPLDSPDDDAPSQTCDAFPQLIPAAIWNMRADHRLPFAGDQGIQWESDGSPYPQAALEAAQASGL